MIPIHTPNQVIYRNKAAVAQLTPLQSALAFSFITVDPKVQSIAARILFSINSGLSIALLLKSASYFMGLSITIISAFSFTALLAATVIGWVGGILIYIASKQLVTSWLDYRAEKYGPIRDHDMQAKYQLQRKLRALDSTLNTFVPHWQSIINSKQPEVVRCLFKHPHFVSTYKYTDEQYEALGDEFKYAYEAFREGALKACEKGDKPNSWLTNQLFQQLVLDTREKLQATINQKIEFFLFPDDLQALAAYKRGLFDYLQSKIPQFPKEKDATRSQVIKLVHQYHADTTKTPDTELQTLIQQAARLMTSWSKISAQLETLDKAEGLWISEDLYQSLRDSRTAIENAMTIKGELTCPDEDMTLPIPLFTIEADHHLTMI
jgi:hypothetical protein